MTASPSQRFVRVYSILLAGVCLSVAGTARAAGGGAGADRKASGKSKAHVATPAEIAVARRLFHEASKLEKDKKWADAAKKLHGALDIKETPGLRYHLAFCEENMGRLVQALVDYDRAGEMISDGVKAPDVAARLDAARTALKKRVPTLTVTMPTDVDWTELSVDGHVMSQAVAGQPIPLDPGQHQVQVTADGYKPFDATVTLAEGDRKTTAVKLDKAEPAASATTPAPAPPPAADAGAKGGAFPLRTAVLIGEGAVTLAGLGVGIGFTVARGNASSRADDAQAAIDKQTGNPGDPSACANAASDVQTSCDALKSALSDKDKDGKLATVGFIGAGVGAAATIATWLLWKPAKKEHALAVTVQPVAGGGMLYGVSGRF